MAKVLILERIPLTNGEDDSFPNNPARAVVKIGKMGEEKYLTNEYNLIYNVHSDHIPKPVRFLTHEEGFDNRAIIETLAPGKSFAEQMRSLTTKQLQSVMRQITEATADLHAGGYQNRDFKQDFLYDPISDVLTIVDLNTVPKIENINVTEKEDLKALASILLNIHHINNSSLGYGPSDFRDRNYAQFVEGFAPGIKPDFTSPPLRFMDACILPGGYQTVREAADDFAFIERVSPQNVQTECQSYLGGVESKLRRKFILASLKSINQGIDLREFEVAESPTLISLEKTGQSIDNKEIVMLQGQESRVYGVNNGELLGFGTSSLIVGENKGPLDLFDESSCVIRINDHEGTQLRKSAIGTIGTIKSTLIVSDESRIYVDLRTSGTILIDGENARIVSPQSLVKSENDIWTSINLSKSGEEGIKFRAELFKKAHYTLPPEITSLSSLIVEGKIDEEKVTSGQGTMNKDGSVTFVATNGNGDTMNVTFEIQQIPDAEGKLSPMFVMRRDAYTENANTVSAEQQAVTTATQEEPTAPAVVTEATVSVPKQILQEIRNRTKTTLAGSESAIYGVNGGVLEIRDKSVVFVEENNGFIDAKGSFCTVRVNKEKGAVYLFGSTIGTIGSNEGEGHVIVFDSASGYIDSQTGEKDIVRISGKSARLITPQGVTRVHMEVGHNEEELKSRHYTLPKEVITLSSLLKENGEPDTDKITLAHGMIHVENGNATVVFTAVNGMGNKIDVYFEIQRVPDKSGGFSPMFVLTEVVEAKKPSPIKNILNRLKRKSRHQTT